MGKKGKQKEPITYVGQSAKNWREKVKENNKKALEHIKKYGTGATPKNKKPMVKLERARPGSLSAQWADKNGMVDPRLK